MAEPCVQDFFRSGKPGVELYCEMDYSKRASEAKTGKCCRPRTCSLTHVTACIQSIPRGEGQGLDNHN